MSVKNQSFLSRLLGKVASIAILVYLMWLLQGSLSSNQNNGWYAKVDQETGEIDGKNLRQKELTKDFWHDIITSDKFKKFIEDQYKIGVVPEEIVTIVNEDELEDV